MLFIATRLSAQWKKAVGLLQTDFSMNGLNSWFVKVASGKISSDILETMCPVLITEWGLRFETLCLVRGDLIEAKTISM